MSDKLDIAKLVENHRSGWALDQRFYTDPSVYQFELDRIISRNWILVGHASQIANPGDFLTFNHATDSAIIVRGRDGTIRAFANVCRHRGSLICLENNGNSRKFVCPYHGWTYDHEGSLLAARSMPEDFVKEEHSLLPVSLEIIGGFIFVCFYDNPPSLSDAQRDLAEPISWFDFKNLKVAAEKTYPIAANWKLAIENYQECYHCATAHPEYSEIHTRKFAPERRERLQESMQSKMLDCGLGNLEIDFIDTWANPGQQGYGYERMALIEGYQTGSRDGKPLAPLLGNLTGFDGAASDFVIGPFTFLLAYSDHVVAYVFSPVDHSNCTCKIFWLVRGDAIEGKDYDVEALTWLWDITTQADEKIIVNNWKGVRSRYYKPGPFSKMEAMEQRYIDWILQELAGKEGS